MARNQTRAKRHRKLIHADLDLPPVPSFVVGDRHHAIVQDLHTYAEVDTIVTILSEVEIQKCVPSRHGAMAELRLVSVLVDGETEARQIDAERIIRRVC